MSTEITNENDFDMIKEPELPKWHAVLYAKWWQIQDDAYYDTGRNLLDEEEFPKLAEHHAKIMAASPELVMCLVDYVRAQSNMIDRYSEGGEAVKKQLWQKLHECELPARQLLENLGILPFGTKSIFNLNEFQNDKSPIT